MTVMAFPFRQMLPFSYENNAVNDGGGSASWVWAVAVVTLSLRLCAWL